MRTIAIVLTRYKDPLSRLVYALNGGGFTHVSLSLDEELETMYSFNLKGFAVESAQRFRRQGVTQGKCYRLRISDAAYARLARHIEAFVQNRKRYRYSLVGVWCCFFGIPLQQKGRYFCSQFVAECLLRARAVPLRRLPSLYLPNNLMREMNRSLQLQRVQYVLF